MTLHDTLLLSVILLGAAVIAVPLFRYMKLGSVVGYLVAGALIAPYVSRQVEDTQTILHFSEIGVVLFLFLTGLEINPRTLWEMRHRVFGLGSLQMLICIAVFGGIFMLFLPDWQIALVVGTCLAFSSTAIVLQNLEENGELVTPSGRVQLAILLLQDMAVVPALALVVFLAPDSAASAGGAEGEMHWALSGLLKISVVAALYFGGRYLLNPIFRFVARVRSRDIFTALALLVVLVSASLMELIGISMALGGFIAGLVLSESEYRHQIESEVEPFKSIILGIFFLAVGMSIDWELLKQFAPLVFGLCLAYLAIKMLVMFFIARLGGLKGKDAIKLAVNISQGGEFAFVVIQSAAENPILGGTHGQILTLLISMSMILSPLISFVLPYVLRKFSKPLSPSQTERPYDDIPEQERPVIIVGFGRFGQVLARVLSSQNIPFVAVDKDIKQIEVARRFGSKVYYGDPSDLKLLRAAGAEHARCMAICIDAVKTSVKMVEQAQRNFPHLKLLARARDRTHARALLQAGLKEEFIYRELFDTSLAMTCDLLEELDFTPARSRDIARIFRDFDQRMLRNDLSNLSREEIEARTKDYQKELESLFAREKH